MAYEQVWNFPGKRFNLTVSERPEEAAAVFAEDGDSIQREEGSEQKCYRITKIVVSFLTVIAVLFCVVASKISAIAVAQSLGDHVNGTFLDVDEVATPLTFFYKPYAGDTSNHTAGAGELPEYQQVTIFMLVLLLGIPYVFSLARCIWVGGFSCGCDKNSSKPWPSVGAILVGFVSSVFEVTGLWLVVLLLFPWMSAFTALAVSTTVFIWPNIWATVEPFLLRLSCFRYDKIDKMEDSGSSDAAFGVGCSSKAETVVNMVFVVLNILGLCLLAVFQQIDMEAHYRASDAWLLPIVCFLLTFAWWPWMLKRQLIKSGVHGGNGESDRFGHQKPDKLVRWKAGILSNFWKLVLTFTLPMLFSYVRYGNYSYFTFLTRPVWYVHLRLLTHPAFGYFLLNILTSFGGYIFTWFADSINAGFDIKKTVAGRFNIKTYLSLFFIPLSLATPIAAFVVGEVNTCSLLPHFHCDSLTGHQAAIGVLAIVILFIVNFFSIGRFILNNKTLVLAKESQLFWLSSYNGVMLEQWLWLNRKTYRTDTTKRNPDHLRKEATIYINTTMYNESAEEMGQLLQSLRRVRDDRHANSPAYYSHIWLDGAFDTKKKGDVFNTNTLRLLSLLQDIFDVSFAPGDKGFEKVRTKYGMRLTWKFPLNSTEALEDPERYTMSLNLHLKDNRKVKNKKRWSQIMYLSLVLDYLNQKPREGATAEELKQWEQRLQNSYILATDADVKFTLPSVEALLEIYLRDDSLRIGAVCGRTHPLGSQVQPVVSYQVFDYAVGHWFQKVSNHMLGSVLCAPGCFSLYRCNVLRKVTSIYGSTTNSAFEFLYKDMGEDRWLCSLMITASYHLAYTGAAENKTFCPEGFEEFFKQRRRWVVSTIANMFLLIGNFKEIITKNPHVSTLFMIYQTALLVSSFVGPATVILVIAGGLDFAFNIPNLPVAIILTILSGVFLYICLKTSGDTQMNIAILLSAVFALITSASFIGTIRQLVSEYSALPDILANKYNYEIWEMPIPTSSIYFTTIIVMFLIASVVHPTEFTCIFHGLTYLFFLPAGYLFLTIYSLCNITDQSWGTREAKTIGGADDDILTTVVKAFQAVCCAWRNTKTTPQPIIISNVPHRKASVSQNTPEEKDNKERPSNVQLRRQSSVRRSKITAYYDKKETTEDCLRVEDWLEANFFQEEIKQCAPWFKTLGYGDTSFIAGMTKEEIRSVGITKPDHLAAVHAAAAGLPAFTIDPYWPATESERRAWILSVGLEGYEDTMLPKFEELPKTTELSKLRVKFSVYKPGHLKRLYNVIQLLREPTTEELNIMTTRRAINMAVTSPAPSEEDQFWSQVVEEKLKPQTVFKESKMALEDELIELRNSALVAFAICNLLWLVIFLTLGNLSLDDERSDLSLFGTNPIGLLFLGLFSVLLVIQFLAMLAHRLLTFVHLISRVSWTPDETSATVKSRDVTEGAKVQVYRQSERSVSTTSLVNSMSHTTESHYGEGISNPALEEEEKEEEEGEEEEEEPMYDVALPVRGRVVYELAGGTQSQLISGN